MLEGGAGGAGAQLHKSPFFGGITTCPDLSGFSFWRVVKPVPKIENWERKGTGKHRSHSSFPPFASPSPPCPGGRSRELPGHPGASGSSQIPLYFPPPLPKVLKNPIYLTKSQEFIYSEPTWDPRRSSFPSSLWSNIQILIN